LVLCCEIIGSPANQKQYAGFYHRLNKTVDSKLQGRRRRGRQ
jgi:hypothetical protein